MHNLEESIRREKQLEKSRPRIDPILPESLTTLFKSIKKNFNFRGLTFGVIMSYTIINFAGFFAAYDSLKKEMYTVKDFKENGMFIYNDSIEHSELSEKFGRGLVSFVNISFRPGMELACWFYNK